MLDSGQYTRKSVQFQFYFLQTRHSNVRQVTLRKVSLLTSGVYRCEVTSKLSPAGIDSEVKEDRLVVLGEFSTLIYSRLRLHIRCFLGLQFEIADLNVRVHLKIRQSSIYYTGSIVSSTKCLMVQVLF